MRKPAFQFYPQDFLVGTADMEPEEVGAYIRLLCYQWEKCGLPNDNKKLQKLSGCQNIDQVLVKFKICDDGLLRNEKLESVRNEQNEYFRKKIEAGRLGAEIKKSKHNVSTPKAKLKQTASPSSSSSSSNSDTPSVIIADQKKSALYTNFISAYDLFVQDKTGLPAKIDGIQGKNAKEIIAYFTRACKNKNPGSGENEILESWKLVLGNYDKWEPFHKGQLELRHINSNLVSIINSIRNGIPKGRQPATSISDVRAIVNLAYGDQPVPGTESSGEK